MTTTKLGVGGIVMIVVALVCALAIPQAWYLVRTRSYTAQFENAGGLTESDPVYVAGVPEGRVDSVDIVGTHVQVSFRLDRDHTLGDRTHASIQLRTILGKRYLEIVPDGGGSLGTDNTIPLERTSVPYSLDQISAAANTTAAEVDVPGLEEMVRTLRESLPENSSTVRDAITGIGSASALLAENDEQISGLLDASRSLTTSLAAESASLSSLVSNAEFVLSVLADRRTALSQLVNDLRTVTATASTFLDDNSAELDHLIGNLRGVTDTLDRNGQNIDTLMTTLPAALRAVTDATGNGNWVDVSAPAGPIADNLLCTLGIQTGCR